MNTKENQWKTNGKPMKANGNVVKTNGKPMENQQKANGNTMDNQWKNNGSTRETNGNQRKINGTSMDINGNQRKINGKPMEKPIESQWKSNENPLKSMHFHDFPRLSSPGWKVLEPPPQVMCEPSIEPFR